MSYNVHLNYKKTETSVKLEGGLAAQSLWVNREPELEALTRVPENDLFHDQQCSYTPENSFRYSTKELIVALNELKKSKSEQQSKKRQEQKDAGKDYWMEESEREYFSYIQELNHLIWTIERDYKLSEETFKFTILSEW